MRSLAGFPVVYRYFDGQSGSYVSYGPLPRGCDDRHDKQNLLPERLARADMLYGPYATPSTNLETWTFKDFREHGERISTFPKVLKCPRNHNFETKRFKKLKGE